MSTLVNGLSQPFAALQALLQAEEAEESRAKLSQVAWYADVLRLSSSTIPRVWKPILGVTLWATAIAVLDIVYGVQGIYLTNNVVPLLSVVVGLLLVFRNSSAFARWLEGRQLFSSMATGVRNLARVAWVKIGSAPYDPDRINTQGDRVPWQCEKYTSQEKEEKVAALRMLVAMVVAAKYHVREEYDNENYDDLTALLPMSFLSQFRRKSYGYGGLDSAAPELMRRRRAHLKNKASAASMQSIISMANTTASAIASPNGVEAASDQAPLLAQASHAYHDAVAEYKLFGRPSLPLPLVIAHRLQLYMSKCKSQGLMESMGVAGANAMTEHVSELVKYFTAMERLLTLPLPTIYGVHLKQTVTLYLFILPLTLVETMSWKMIPAVTVIAFTLMGIEGIASEIEAPFGYDASDLPLDYICAELRCEVEQMISRLKETPTENFMF